MIIFRGICLMLFSRDKLHSHSKALSDANQLLKQKLKIAEIPIKLSNNEIQTDGLHSKKRSQSNSSSIYIVTLSWIIQCSDGSPAKSLIFDHQTHECSYQSTGFETMEDRKDGDDDADGELVSLRRKVREFKKEQMKITELLEENQDDYNDAQALLQVFNMIYKTVLMQVIGENEYSKGANDEY